MYTRVFVILYRATIILYTVVSNNIIDLRYWYNIFFRFIVFTVNDFDAQL